MLRPDARAAILGSLRTAGRRLKRKDDVSGVAAVEFALLAPVMIGLYLSTVVTTQAYMSSRKVALVARALADVTSRQPTGTSGCTPTTSGDPCLANADITSIFDAGALIMAPYSISPLKMTLSRIDVLNDTSGTPQTWAIVKWSVTYNGATGRPCNGANSSFTSNTAYPGVTTSTTNKPLQVGSYQPTQSSFQNYLPSQYTASGAPTGYLIVADVAYTYTPGFSFKVWNWSNLTSINTGWTQAFWSRTGLPIEGGGLTSGTMTPVGASSSTNVTTTVTQCSANGAPST
ncbi:MAG: pilus assembly protein [Hyphomicrobiales bacterium]|nr:pilus assembly protein [Hyphomicrobiales bacterium]